MTQSLKFDSADKWKIFSEPIPRYDQTSLKASILLDHANTTKDATDYLWYTLRFQKNSSDSKAILNVSSESHVLRAYVNGAFADSAHGNRKNPPSSLQSQIKLNRGMNDISLLSAMVGLRVGLVGEKQQVYTSEGSRKVQWDKYSSSKLLTWYKAAEGARIAGASRIIGIDMNPNRFKEGSKFDVTEFDVFLHFRIEHQCTT